MLPFDKVFTKLARTEVGVIYAHDAPRLPDGVYIYREFFCDACDCRRVELRACTPNDARPLATIQLALRLRPHGHLDRPRATLDSHQPQAALAPALLQLLEALFDWDPGYVTQRAQHYALWRSVVENPDHPGYEALQAAARDASPDKPAGPLSGMQ